MQLPQKYNEFSMLEIEYDEQAQTCWVFMNATPRPCFSLALLSQLHLFLTYVQEDYPLNIKFLVVASKHPKSFNLGGDLNLFFEIVSKKDSKTLTTYARDSANLIYRNYYNFKSAILTIALVEGEAMGGGLEAALSCNYIIAQKGVSIGFPESLFNTFPGAGAMQLLSRRIPLTKAQELVTNGKVYSSEDALHLGLIDKVCEKGKGREAVSERIQFFNRNFASHLAVCQVKDLVLPLKYDELMEVADIWVDTVMNLSPRDLKLIEKLVQTQNKRMNDIYL